MERSFTVECPPFEVEISHWDRILPPTHSKRILCFSLPDATDKQQVVDYLHIAFHHTVQRLPLLAGSVVPFSSHQGGRPWLRNIIPEGGAQLIVKDLSEELSFSDLAKANFSQHLLNTEQLCPLPEVGYFKEERVDVCRFQANFIEGGLLLVVSIIHNAADGRGVTEVIKTFANELSKAQSGETHYPLEPRPDVYRSDRTKLVSGHGVPGSIENHAAWTSDPANAHAQIHNVENSCRTFRISVKALTYLKDCLSATVSGPDEWFSTNDAISAFIWRSIMLARHRAGILNGDAETYVAQPVDCRAHLKIPMPYFGNVIYMTKSSVPLSDLADFESGLGTAARALRADIKAVTAEKFGDLVGYAERTALDTHTRLNILEAMSTSGIILTSLFKMDLHGMNFGPVFGDGHIKAVRLPARGTQAGAVIVLPRVPDGSCEFMVTEQESTIKCLLEDKYFSRFTNDADTIGTPHEEVVAPLPPPPITSGEEDVVSIENTSPVITVKSAPDIEPVTIGVSAAEVEPITIKTSSDVEPVTIDITTTDVNPVGTETTSPVDERITIKTPLVEPVTVAVPTTEVESITTESTASEVQSLTTILKDWHLVPTGDVTTPSTLISNRVDAPHVGTIKIIQLNRPAAKNALSVQMVRELSREIEEIHHERHTGGTRALIIGSAVDGIFCAGADLRERKNMSLTETQAFLTSLRGLFSRLASLPIPTIACISGRALGGGLELALCCHLRVFSSDAVVALPETRLAIIPGAGGTYRLPNIVGMSNALDMILTGRGVPADEAATMGLCNRLVRADLREDTPALSKRALVSSIQLAEQIADAGPIAIRAAITALSYSCEAVENAAYESVLKTKDREAALDAFSEKRKPILIGE
jgi:enoyl-CoA hydratase/carnithine racemase